ncbi:MAG: hypothetical protein K5739_05140, partial [Lachnospiraceae bacterium]|nr:hypothetical protein [Lachnospiraceae bacterium]
WNEDTGIAVMDCNGHIVASKNGQSLEWECSVPVESKFFAYCLRYSDSLEDLMKMSKSKIPAHLY